MKRFNVNALQLPISLHYECNLLLTKNHKCYTLFIDVCGNVLKKIIQVSFSFEVAFYDCLLRLVQAKIFDTSELFSPSRSNRDHASELCINFFERPLFFNGK